jgi:hypothetical protein
MALAYLFYFSVISAFYANISTNTVKTTQSGQLMETITEQGTPICLDFETSHMFTCVVVIWSIIHVGVIVVLSALLILFFTCRDIE